MREEASSCTFFEKFRVSNWKLEIDGPKPPKKRKVLSPYEKAEAPVEFVSTVEGYYHKILISAEIYTEIPQVIEILLVKLLHEEEFGHEL